LTGRRTIIEPTVAEVEQRSLGAELGSRFSTRYHQGAIIIADLLDLNDTKPFDHPSGGYDWVARVRVDSDTVEIAGDAERARRLFEITGVTGTRDAAGNLVPLQLSFAADPETWLRESHAIFRTAYVFFTVYADDGAPTISGPFTNPADERLAERTTAMLAAATSPSSDERMLLPWSQPPHEGASLSTQSRAYWRRPGSLAV
jgi:hypothetical protein